MISVLGSIANASFLAVMKSLVSDEAVRHAIASVQHDIWAHWNQYVIDSNETNEDGDLIIPAGRADGWRRQIATHYDNLTDREKQSDLEQADKVLAVFDPANYSSQQQRTIRIDPKLALLPE